MAVCSGCGQSIKWMRNETTNKRAPVNLKPDPGGNVELVDDELYKVMTKAEMAAPEMSLFDTTPKKRTTLHFATCPAKTQFKRCGVCHKTPCTCAKQPSGSI